MRSTLPQSPSADPGLFFNEDCIAGCQNHIADNSVDLIITDPPYGIQGDELHIHYNRKEEYVIDGYVEIPASHYAQFSREWIQQAERILRPGGSIYIVSGYSHLAEILTVLKETTLKEINHLIWKYNFGVYTSKKFVSSHYHILYYVKPPRKPTFNTYCRYGQLDRDDSGGALNYLDREDVWIIKRTYKPGQQKNKNELPQELLMKIIQYSSNPGDLVFDLFLGGFSTARTAIGLGRRAGGFEISENVFNYHIGKMKTLVPGYLLEHLPVVSEGRIARKGMKWTPSDIEQLHHHFQALVQTGKSQKEIIRQLCVELERGRFAIRNRLFIEGLLRNADIKLEPESESP